MNAFETSIERFEGLRSSYTIAQRGRFFQTGPVRKVYWGLIRATAKQAVATQTEADFWATLQATERIRARQYAWAVNASSLKCVTVRHATLPHNTCNTNNRAVTQGGSTRSRQVCFAAVHACRTIGSLIQACTSSLTRRTAEVILAIHGLLVLMLSLYNTIIAGGQLMRKRT